MIADEVRPVPVELWEWGHTMRSGPQRRYPEKQVRLSLLPTDTASVTTQGVEFYGCRYSCPTAIEERWFDRARQKGRWRVSISYDPRFMDEIHIHDSKGDFGFLSCTMTDLSGAMRGKTPWEIDALRQEDKGHKTAADRVRREGRINLNREIRVSLRRRPSSRTVWRDRSCPYGRPYGQFVFAARGRRVGRRRRWSDAEKLRIVAESMAGRRLVSATARRHDISRSQLNTWRRLAREGRLVDDRDLVEAAAPTFAPVVVAADPPTPPAPGEDRVEILLANGRRMLVSVGVDADGVARLVRALEGT